MKQLHTFFLVLTLTACLAEEAPPVGAPNILFIFTDDHSTESIGAYDGWLKELNPTPAIDKLAGDGMVMRQSFCTNSICGPSRAVILTGKHSHKNGFLRNGNSFDWGQQSFAKLLQEAGYQTALFGKTHLKGRPQGFDEWAILPGQGDYFQPALIFPDGQRQVEGHCTDVVTDLAVDFLQSKRDPAQPFVMMVQHKAPHRNWMPAPRHLSLYAELQMPEPPTLFDKFLDNASPVARHEMGIERHMSPGNDLFLNIEDSLTQSKEELGPMFRRMTEAQFRSYQRHYGTLNRSYAAVGEDREASTRWRYQRYLKNYLRCIRGVDESVARLVQEIDDLGLTENTLVIYSSDQGFFLGEHGWYDKRWMYEESLRMPFIAKWPAVIEPGSSSEALIQNLDYAQTFLDVAGVAQPDDMQGRSLLPLLRGETPTDWRESIYYHYFEFPSVHMVPRQCGVRTARYKLIHFYEFDEWELYDLQTDPDEVDNLYGKPKYEELTEDLKQELTNLRTQYEDRTDLSPMPEEWRQSVYTQKAPRTSTPVKTIDN